MRCRICRLQFLLTYGICQVALLTKIKIETLFAFVPHAHNWHHLAPVTFNILAYLLPRLDNQLNSMCFFVVAPHLDSLMVVCPGEEAVLAHAEVVAISADEACTYDWPLITADAFIIIMSR